MIERAVALPASIGVLGTSAPAAAQMYEGESCRPEKALPTAQLDAGKVAFLGDDWAGQYEAWATTWLAPSGKAPVVPLEDLLGPRPVPSKPADASRAIPSP